MKVSLIANTPHPEEVITLAAKMCYSNKTIDEMSIEEYEDFIKRLMELGHESPIEHVTFTFGIEGISRSASHQLVRHRIASYSQKSQRYVKEDQFDYVVPPTIEGMGAEDRFKKLMGQDFSSRMIELASAKMPEAHLFQGDIINGLVTPLLLQSSVGDKRISK